jgi:Protein of unknown function (DUF2782)
MRRLLSVIFFSILLCPIAWAQESKPSNLEPLPEPPPPPADMELDPALEPQVTIIKRGGDRVEEYRINGQLYMMKVIPAKGPAYYLVDQQGDGQFARQDNLDSEVRPPMWVIHQF